MELGPTYKKLEIKEKAYHAKKKAAEAKAKGVAGVKTVYKYGVAFRKK